MHTLISCQQQNNKMTYILQPYISSDTRCWQDYIVMSCQKPLMSNLQLVRHLTSYSDSESESSLSGPVLNQSPHWLSYPIVTVVHLNLLIRMECIFLYSLAFSQFYLLLLVSNVTSCNCAEANRLSVVCLSFIKASLLVFIFLRTQQLLCRWSYSIM